MHPPTLALMGSPGLGPPVTTRGGWAGVDSAGGCVTLVLWPKRREPNSALMSTILLKSVRGELESEDHVVCVCVTGRPRSSAGLGARASGQNISKSAL